MKKSIYRKSAWDFLRTAVLPVLFTLSVMALIVSGLNQTESSSSAESLRILEDSIRRAVVVSYAVEGRYPGSIEYIEERFGIHIDRTRYVVHYDIFASNLMPTIAVIEL
jgi:hypothetical protein